MFSFMTSIPFMTAFLLLASLLSLHATASPTNRLIDTRSLTEELHPRTTPPFFPDSPASCPICAQVCVDASSLSSFNYDAINSCAEAAPVLANFSMIIFNPGAFVDVIKCACTDTFQSTYPQCVDCFSQTNQTQVLNYDTANLPDIVSGMRRICAISSSLLGNVSQTNGEVTPVASSPAPSPTSAASHNVAWGGAMLLMLLAVSVGCLEL